EHEIHFCLMEQGQVSGMAPTCGVATDIENGIMQKNYFPRSLRRQQILLGEGKLLVGFFLESKIQSQHVYWSNVIRITAVLARQPHIEKIPAPIRLVIAQRRKNRHLVQHICQRAKKFSTPELITPSVRNQIAGVQNEIRRVPF